MEGKMANTIKSSVLNRSVHSIALHWTLSSDGTNETATVVYDSSVHATALAITDPLSCVIESIHSVVSAASTARVWLNFDASTPVLALTLPVMNTLDSNFKEIGGLKDTGGAGITGDIAITTTGLASGDKIELVIVVRPNA
jgi:hypothetical protein